MIYPTRRAVALAAGAAALVLAAALWPALMGAAVAALACIVAVAVLDARRSLALGAPQLERELPRRAHVGRACDVRYRLQLESPGVVAVLDELPRDLGGDRRFGPIALAAGAGSHTLECSLVPARRGLRRLGSTHVMVRSPLQLFIRRFSFAQEQSLAVYPADARRDRRGAVSRNVRSEFGLRPQRLRGEASEFESLREYSPDDEPRRIDWRASARARRPVVREYQTERNHTLIIAVDCGRLMSTHIDGQSKLDHALAAAIGLARASVQCQDRVGFAAFDHELCAWVAPQRAGRALAPILEATLALEPRAHESSYRALAEAMRQRQKKRSLLVVLTDFVEGAAAVELKAYLSALSGRHCVLLVGLRDRLLRELERPAPALSGQALYRRLVLQDLDSERDVALAQIARTGVHTIDLDPAAITGPLLERYLRIRETGLM